MAAGGIYVSGFPFSKLDAGGAGHCRLGDFPSVATVVRERSVLIRFSNAHRLSERHGAAVHARTKAEIKRSIWISCRTHNGGQREQANKRRHQADGHHVSALSLRAIDPSHCSRCRPSRNDLGASICCFAIGCRGFHAATIGAPLKIWHRHRHKTGIPFVSNEDDGTQASVAESCSRSRLIEE